VLRLLLRPFYLTFKHLSLNVLDDRLSFSPEISKGDNRDFRNVSIRKEFQDNESDIQKVLRPVLKLLREEN
jgi:hypothetical protein